MTRTNVDNPGPMLCAPKRVLLVLAGLLPILWACPSGRADEPVIMRIEQDWECVLNEPDDVVDAPQFHTVIAPYGGLDSYYLQVCWNYREMPDFQAGGMQLLVYDPEQGVGSKSCREDRLSTAAETVSWTQSMLTNGGTVLKFEVKNGSSTTWGSFGGSEMSLSGNVGVPNLNGYSTDVSVQNSWISYGANRVNKLVITEVRSYDVNNNLIARDQTLRTVYELEN